CEEEISPKRLAAVPWSPYCIRCQEMADRHREKFDDSDLFEEMMTAA
ncbi:MAG: TraR/DksA C4-type zinc finger protein, partial [Bryobacterales bacterium]|nr:TraR/DksA C4-type zinc finger protein [Bryobacterales bacterium]